MPENVKHNRRSIRLRGYDYSKPGAYFVTLCVQNRECLFGEITNGKLRLNEYGRIIREKWEWLAEQYAYVKLDEYMVMPNHFHGILWICDISRIVRRGGSRTAPTNAITTSSSRTAHTDDNTSMTMQPDIKIKPLGRLVGAFKTVSAKQINICRNTAGASVWQRDFYDHIGRDESNLFRIREYIRKNPINWDSDQENPIKKSPWHVAMPNAQRQYLCKPSQI